jgi:hypothetical protein
VSRGVLFQGLRPYQLEAGRAVIESVRGGRGLTFSIEVARQGGKNELSARIEMLLLLVNAGRDVAAVKAAPTFRPQALISLRRLWSRLAEAGLGEWARREDGHVIRFGRARQVFLSAGPASNVVGHTADLLLEVDEAQDVDIEKFEKELRPMAASAGATTVLYGTAWDESNLLEAVRRENLEAEGRDGVRRHFEYDWRVVAAANPAYGRFVRREMERLGPQHPLFLTQYALRPLPEAGRFLGAAQLSLLEGDHGELDAPRPGEEYVAGLDLAGEGEAGGSRDSTVLTIGRVARDGGEGPPAVEVVRFYEWTGTPHGELYRLLARLLGSIWRVRRVAVDATGLGEPVAARLREALGEARVEAVKLGQARKSALGYDFLAAVNEGRLRLPLAGSRESLEARRQLRLCRAAYRPNRTLSFHVDSREGHDDHVMSLALLVAAAPTGGPRRARGRLREEEGAW